MKKSRIESLCEPTVLTRPHSCDKRAMGRYMEGKGKERIWER